MVLGLPPGQALRMQKTQLSLVGLTHYSGVVGDVNRDADPRCTGKGIQLTLSASGAFKEFFWEEVGPDLGHEKHECRL